MTSHIELSGWGVRWISRLLRVPVIGRAISRLINVFVVDRDLRAIGFEGDANIAPWHPGGMRDGHLGLGAPAPRSERDP